jgi:hypothetical protein
VPYLLGFAPTSSIVLVFFDVDQRHVLTARIGWPTPADLSQPCLALVIETCRSARGNGADGAQVVLYPPASRPPSLHTETVCAVADSMRGTEIALRCLGTIADGFWRDLLDLPGQAEQLNDSGLSASCQWVANGISYLPDRQSLVERIDGDPTTTCIRLTAALQVSGGEGYAPAMSRARDRRAIEDAIYNYLLPADIPPTLDTPDVQLQLPPDAHILRWALALADRRIREPLLWRFAQVTPETDGAGRQALAGLSLLVRHTPDPVIAALASCAAALAWQQGNGALAQIAAERGLKADPRNVLCKLVFKAVEQGVHPSIWVEMLNSMTLHELRSGRMQSGMSGTGTRSKYVRDCPG